MEERKETQFVGFSKDKELEVGDVLEAVYRSLKSKGYNPTSQIVGYVLSGDPTYITSYNNARSIIQKVERDEIIEEMMKCYIENKLEKA